MASFLRHAMERKKIDCRELSRRSGVTEATISLFSRSGAIGYFTTLCSLMLTLGVTFMDCFDYLNEPYEKGMLFFCRKGFLLENKSLKQHSLYSERRIGSLLAKDTSAYTHLSSESYGHWIQFKEIILICDLFSLPLSRYLGEASVRSIEAVVTDAKRGIRTKAEEMILFPLSDEVAPWAVD